MEMKQILLLNRILLGVTMLIPGLLKLFDLGTGVTGMLSEIVLFAWAPAFWAWVLIVAEIGSGIAILANYKLKYVVWLPIIILIIVAFVVNWGNWVLLLVHTALASNYLVWGFHKN